MILRKPGWCKNALERGITVTLGPTGEPYVDAFPLPNEFFALLLTGRYTLAEAYALPLATSVGAWCSSVIRSTIHGEVEESSRRKRRFYNDCVDEPVRYRLLRLPFLLAIR